MSIPNIAPVTPIPTATAPTDEDLVRRRAELAADAEYIAEQIAEIDAALLDRFPGTGTHDVAGVKVQIREYSRTDYAALAAQYPAADYPALYSTDPVLDQTAVKKSFAPAALDEFKVTGKRSVVIK